MKPMDIIWFTKMSASEVRKYATVFKLGRKKPSGQRLYSEDEFKIFQKIAELKNKNKSELIKELLEKTERVNKLEEQLYNTQGISYVKKKNTKPENQEPSRGWSFDHPNVSDASLRMLPSGSENS